jgi:hypothetical protein
MFIDELGVAVTAKENAEAVEPRDDALELHAVDEKYGEGNFLLTDVVQERILKAWRAFGRHFVFLSDCDFGSRYWLTLGAVYRLFMTSA